MVSILASYSNDQCSNPAEVDILTAIGCLKSTKINKKTRPELVHFKNRLFGEFCIEIIILF